MTKPQLWAPWRIDYLQSIVGDQPPGQPGDCFLCQAGAPDLDDATADQRLVLHRDDHGTLLLNRYPYSSGHLLVAPHDHVGDLSDLDPPTRAGLMELCELGGRLLRETINPQGLNVGANLGRAAGAGVPGHLHLHVVPRWAGDCNFMDVVGHVRVIPQALEASHRLLKEALPTLL
jgi:ATP adenylyltransferase